MEGEEKVERGNYIPNGIINKVSCISLLLLRCGLVAREGHPVDYTCFTESLVLG